jgi:hypothetical protein
MIPLKQYKNESNKQIVHIIVKAHILDKPFNNINQ